MTLKGIVPKKSRRPSRIERALNGGYDFLLRCRKTEEVAKTPNSPIRVTISKPGVPKEGRVGSVVSPGGSVSMSPIVQIHSLSHSFSMSS